MAGLRFWVAKLLWRLASRVEPDVRCSAFPDERLTSSTYYAGGYRYGVR